MGCDTEYETGLWLYHTPVGLDLGLIYFRLALWIGLGPMLGSELRFRLVQETEEHAA